MKNCSRKLALLLPPQTSMGTNTTPQQSSQSRITRDTVSPECEASYQDAIRGKNWMDAINPNSVDVRTGLSSDTIPPGNLPALHPKDREPHRRPSPPKVRLDSPSLALETNHMLQAHDQC